MTASAPYGPRSTNRRRRTRAEIEAIREAIVSTLAADHPASVRGLFYALTTQGVIAKTEAEYRTVKRLTADMRRSGEIPFQWLADATRWMRKPMTYSSVESALKRTAETYRRALWDGAPVAVEVWLEKEALAGVLVDVTHEWDVPLMVTRGYPSMSFLHSAALAMRERSEEGQRTQIYYLGDRDPSGVDIDRAVVEGIGESLLSMDNDWTLDLEADPEDRRLAKEETFGEYAGFERIAVTEEQIAEWDLPTRPTKRSDARSKSFEGESVEVDSIPPHQLRALTEEAIERHVDQAQLGVLLTYETEERRELEKIASMLNREGDA